MTWKKRLVYFAEGDSKRTQMMTQTSHHDDMLTIQRWCTWIRNL